MKKDVLIIAHFTSDLERDGNNRFNYISELLSENNFNVELVTSDYSHIKKKKRNKNIKPENYEITYISEPNYTKNISLKRFFSHYKMSKNLEKYLKTRKKPDIIYCAVPSLDIAKVAAKYAKKNNIRFIIDIQDMWPEAFKMIIDKPIINQLIYHKLKKRADYIYKAADDIIAVSNTYLNEVEKRNKKAKTLESIYIGTDLKKIDKILITNKSKLKPSNEFWIAYVGTLGSSYDISSLISAVKLIQTKGVTNIRLIIMGNGPLREKFEKEVNKNNLQANFTGNLDYNKMIGILKQCDIAVNPIVGGSAASIINKHADYAATGLPVINTQESREYQNLVIDYNMGINCKNGNIENLSDEILFLYNNKNLRKKMSKNSRFLAEEKFDRRKTYIKIVEILNNEI